MALIDPKDPDHKRVRTALLRDPGPYIVPSWIMAEIGYFAEKRFGPKVVDLFLADLESGAYSLDCGQDLPRIRALLKRYSDLPLGVADASVIACAERNGGMVLTLDSRAFGVVAKEGTISVQP